MLTFGIMLRKLALMFGLIVVVAARKPQPPSPTPASTPPSPTQTPAPMFTPYLGPTAGPIDPDTQATLRFVLAVPDAPAVDIDLDNTLAVTQLGYGSLSASIPRAAGKYLVRLIPAGGAASSQNRLLEQIVELAPHQAVIGVLTGTASKLVLNRLVENTDSLDARQVRVQVAYALQGNTPINVSIDDQQPEKIQSSGEITAPVVLKADSHDFKPISSVTLRVLKAGSAADAAPLYKGEVALRADQSGDLVIFDQPPQARIFWENLGPTVTKYALPDSGVGQMPSFRSIASDSANRPASTVTVVMRPVGAPAGSSEERMFRSITHAI